MPPRKYVLGKPSLPSASFGDGAVVIHRPGSRMYTTARILGRETDENGIERAWLDRVVLPHSAELEDHWFAEGAVSTVLVRMLLPQLVREPPSPG